MAIQRVSTSGQITYLTTDQTTAFQTTLSGAAVNNFVIASGSNFNGGNSQVPPFITFTDNGTTPNVYSTYEGPANAYGNSENRAFISHGKISALSSGGGLIVTTNRPAYGLLNESILVFSGIDTTSPVRDSGVVAVAGAATGLTVNTAGSSTKAGDLIVATMIAQDYAGSSANYNLQLSGTGWTYEVVQNNSASYAAVTLTAWKIATVDGQQSATFTWNTMASSNAGAAIRTFTQANVAKGVYVTVDPSAAGVTGVRGAIWSNPTGTDIVGAKQAEYTGLSFANTLTSGSATMTIPISFAANIGDTFKVYLTNNTLCTGIIDGVVVAM